jgi:hypothetical protein
MRLRQDDLRGGGGFGARVKPLSLEGLLLGSMAVAPFCTADGECPHQQDCALTFSACLRQRKVL